jgi:hypothetical protein
MSTFYVYVDWTLEDRPRAFYVGKGTTWRLKQKYRNKRHSSIASKHGMRREVVFSTQDEQEAFELECRLIQEHHTYMTKGGANYTLGGDGASGAKRSEETKHRMSEALKGRQHSDETKRKLSEARQKLLMTGWRPILSDEAKSRLSEKAKGREARKRERGYAFSKEHRQKLSEAQKRRHALNRTSNCHSQST